MVFILFLVIENFINFGPSVQYQSLYMESNYCYKFDIDQRDKDCIESILLKLLKQLNNTENVVLNTEIIRISTIYIFPLKL